MRRSRDLCFLPIWQEFFLTVKDLVLKCPSGVAGYHKWNDMEKQLNARSLSEYRMCCFLFVCFLHTKQAHTCSFAICECIPTTILFQLVSVLQGSY